VQSAHAAVEHTARNPGVAGGVLVMLAVRDESALRLLGSRLELWGVDVTWFREPDLHDALTAFAAAGPVASRKLAKIPLLYGRG
jgi:hypothetical protein